jgi:hypothetical protein
METNAIETTTIRQVRDHHLANDYARFLSCYTKTQSPGSAAELFVGQYPKSSGAILVRQALERLSTKAATAAGSTSDAAWAGALVQPLLDAFVAIARSASLLGRIPNLKKVPFNVKVPIQTGDAGYAWVAEGVTKAISKLAFSDGVTLGPAKALGIVVVSDELTKLSAPGTEVALRDTLVAGLTSFTDKSFLDPASTAVAGQRPGSVTSGTTPIASTGNYAADVATLLDAFFTARPGAADAVLICNAGHAAKIRSMNAGGGVGLPVIVSAAALGNTIALDPAATFVADTGVAIETSREAAIEMSDTPIYPPTAAAVITSLWQNNLVGFRVERFLNFKALTGACLYLAG